MGSSAKIAKGVFWTTLANIVNAVYGFVSIPILIAYFGKSNYGLIGLAMSVNVYLRLMDLGLNSSNVRFFSNWLAKNDLDRVNRLLQTSMSFYGIIGLLNALILLVVAFFSGSIFNLTPSQDVIIKNLFYILAISAFVSWFTSCFDQFLRANEFVGWTQKMNLITKVLQIAVLILTVTCHFSIELYYSLFVLSSFIIIPFLINKIRRISPYISFHPKFDKAVLKEILPYSLNIFSFSIFQFSINHLRPVFLGIRGNIESVSDYRILNGITSLVVMFSGAFLGVILPSVSKAVARGDEQAQDMIAYNGTRYISIILCFCCFGVISVGSELLPLYVGEEYQHLNGWLCLWLVVTLTGHNQAISSLILARADIRAITLNTIVASIIGLVLCWFLIPKYQVGGTVIAYGIYGLLQILFYYIYYWPQKMGIDSRRVFFQSFIPYVLLGATLATGCWYLPVNLSSWMALFSKGLIFTIIYTTGSCLLLKKDDKVFLSKLLSNYRYVNSFIKK